MVDCMPRLMGIRCGVKLTRTSAPAASLKPCSHDRPALPAYYLTYIAGLKKREKILFKNVVSHSMGS